MQTDFNPQMLILAREFREYSQSELSNMTGFDNAKLSRFEGGLRQPTDGEVEVLSRALNVPTSFFERPGQRRQVETGELFYRRRMDVSAKALKRIDATVNLLRLNLERLLEVADIEYAFGVPNIRPSECAGGIEGIANAVRYGWRLPGGPIDHLIGTLENASCYIFAVDFGTSKIDAVSHWIEPSPPIILLNSRASSDRMRFSLAHELGHLVMHHTQIPHNDMEPEADEFASAFLLSAEEFTSDAQPVELDRIFQLKPYWKVSGQAMLKRAQMLGLITKAQLTEFMKTINALGYRILEPFPIAPERPALMSKILEMYRSELGYTNEELRSLVAISEQDFNSMYLSSRSPTLRVVPRKEHTQKKSSDEIQGA